MTDKEAVMDALRRRPESASLEEITEELRIMAAVRREIVFRSYRIFYDVRAESHQVDVLHVRHGARDAPVF